MFCPDSCVGHHAYNQCPIAIKTDGHNSHPKTKTHLSEMIRYWRIESVELNPLPWQNRLLILSAFVHLWPNWLCSVEGCNRPALHINSKQHFHPLHPFWRLGDLYAEWASMPWPPWPVGQKHFPAPCTEQKLWWYIPPFWGLNCKLLAADLFLEAAACRGKHAWTECLPRGLKP